MEILYVLGDTWVWDSEENHKSTRIASVLTTLMLHREILTDHKAQGLLILRCFLYYQDTFPISFLHFKYFWESTRCPLSPSGSSEHCVVLQSWIKVLQCPLNLTMLMFHLPTSEVQACLPVAIRFLPLSLVSSPWHPSLSSTLPNVTPALHPLVQATSCHLPPWSLSCITRCCSMSTMTPENTPRLRDVFCCKKALLETQEVPLWVCSFYGHFCNSYYTLDLEQILTTAHNCQSLALYKSSPSKYAAGEK